MAVSTTDTGNDGSHRLRTTGCDHRVMRRRTFLATGGALCGATIAGCSAQQVDDDGGSGSADDGGTAGSVDDGDDTIVVASTEAFVDAPSDSAGPWVKAQFEERTGATLEWDVRNQGINYYIERHNEGVGNEAEVYLNVRPHDLVRIDEHTDGDLFTEIDERALSNVDGVGEEYYFDPEGRVVPTWLSYCSLVYDGRTVENPGSFEALLSEEYRGKFVLSNPQEGTTGLLFMLWTINEFGEDGYLEFWNDLLENDARVLDGWSDVYPQFLGDEVPVIVSYSNDRVYAKRADHDLEKHQVGFLEGQGYANLLGAARFADGTNDELAHEFVDFVLEPEVQAEVAKRNVTGPVNEQAEPPAVYSDYAEHPEEIVFFDYDELSGNLSTWLEEWGREVAGGV